MLKLVLALSVLASPLAAQHVSTPPAIPIAVYGAAITNMNTAVRAANQRPQVQDTSRHVSPSDPALSTTLIGTLRDPSGQVVCNVFEVFNYRHNDRTYITVCSNGALTQTSE